MTDGKQNRATRSALVHYLLAAGLAWTGLAAAEDPGWPRAIETAKGEIVVYQPQLESLEGDRLRSRAAVSVQPKGASDPVFGVIWADSRVFTDRDERTVEIVDVDVTDVRFADATDEQKQKLAELLEAEAEGWNLVISLDRVLASLAANQQQVEIARNLKFDPPVILYADDPAVLILIDGKPRWSAIAEGDLERAVNTPYTLVRVPNKNRYYLDGGVEWYAADDVMGPWTVDAKPPKKVRKLRSEEAAAAAQESIADREGYRPPRVVVATEPTELITTEGSPDYAPVAYTDLLYVDNTTSDILLDTASQRHFVVLSGRWYASKSLDGPWAHVASDALPADFARIPPESPKGNVLVYVAGTPQAEEAVMDAQIPQTAAVKRGRADLTVSYDGAPKFKAIEGTEMEYAINTSSSVLRIDGKYWVCEKAVWYVGEKPTGPWQVADHRPDVVDNLPPSNPHYSTKYVYVYDSTPDVVYVGYTPGYVGSYVYGGCVVYGTGWYYPPWYGHYYYPYSATWGFHMHYNPWYGWGGAVSWSNGPFTISFGFGGYGYGYPGYYPYGGWWGPAGFAYAHHHHYHHGHPGYYRPPGYHRGPGAPSTRPGGIGGGQTKPGAVQAKGGAAGRAGRDNLYNRPENKARIADRGTKGRQPGAAPNRPNNVFAGSDGNVYRRNQDGSWQQKQRDGWSNVNRDRGGTRTGTRPSAGSGEKAGSGRSSSGLERSYGARQRGNQRAGGYKGSRASAGRSGGMSGGARGGARRGGGGRRR